MGRTELDGWVVIPEIGPGKLSLSLSDDRPVTRTVTDYGWWLKAGINEGLFYIQGKVLIQVGFGAF